jgi:hypothetical protein
MARPRMLVARTEAHNGLRARDGGGAMLLCCCHRSRGGQPRKAFTSKLASMKSELGRGADLDESPFPSAAV